MSYPNTMIIKASQLPEVKVAAWMLTHAQLELLNSKFPYYRYENGYLIYSKEDPRHP